MLTSDWLQELLTSDWLPELLTSDWLYFYASSDWEYKEDIPTTQANNKKELKCPVIY